MKNIRQFIDTANIQIKAGDGGDGRVSFRREKFIAKGGPDGGEGGRGGDVYLRADNNMSTLLDFRANPLYKATDGEEGGKKNMTGGDGDDLYINVPIGTLAYEVKPEGDVLVADLDEAHETFLIARGGKGGKGNIRFKSSVNQTPTQYIPGGKGEDKEVRLEVKMVADVGLIGLPNAGKSTLLNRLAHTNVKVASYPFTTLSPNLGTLKYKEGKEIIFADIPGLIEGASTGKGLGDDFLRHVERTRILVHIIDPMGSVSYSDEASAGEIDLAAVTMSAYDVIRKELGDYGSNLVTKKELVVINKMDITEVKEKFPKIKDLFKKRKITALPLSGVTGEGLPEVLDAILKLLSKVPDRVKFETSTPIKLFDISNLPNKRIVFKSDVIDKKDE